MAISTRAFFTKRSVVGGVRVPPHCNKPKTARALPSTAPIADRIAAAQDDDTWLQFAQAVSGEWEGVTATFDGETGAPQPLPERYVPEAYREWGVEISDWQTQCSVDAGGGGGGAGGGERWLRSTLRRLMPTVGCEADAVAFVEEASSAADDAASAADGAATAVLADGSYTRGPAAFDPESASQLRFEACFGAPGPGAAPPAPAAAAQGEQQPQPPQRYRLKVAQLLRRDWSTGAWRVAGVELHRERYDGPHTGRRELAGCGGGQPAVSALPREGGSVVTSDGWVADGAAVVLEAGADGALAPAAAPAKGGLTAGSGSSSGGAPAAPAPVVTALPLGAWSEVVTGSGDGAGGHVVATAGLVLADGRRVVAVREYDGGRLARVALGAERRQ